MMNTILNNYNETEKNYIMNEIKLRTLLHIGKAPQTEKEFKDFCEKVIANKKAEEAKAENAKAKRQATEARKAEELNMTAEEYKAHKALKAKKTRYTNEIAKMKAEIARLERAIAYKEKFLKEN